MGLLALTAAQVAVQQVTAPAAVHADTPAAAPTKTGAVEDLAGLWKAIRVFTPVGPGPLVLRREGGRYVADMPGHTLPLRVDDGELTFDLPNGQGTFRGKPGPEGDFLGHWISAPSSAAMTGFRFASPVRLKPDGRERWVGEVIPFDDTFTFYLLVKKKPDGSMGAVLRNPQRDWGGWLGVTRIERKGDVVRLLGRRASDKVENEKAAGSYDAANDALTLTFPQRGGAYRFTRDTDASAFYPRGRNPERYAYVPPPSRDDGWPVGTLEQANMSRDGIERLVQTIVERSMDSLNTTQLHGLLIARHGKLVLEEYFHGENRDRIHDTRSAAKSLTAILVGAAIQAGAPLTLDSPVYEVMNGGSFPADLEPSKRAMTLETLLTMSSGYFCDDTNPAAPGNEDGMLEQSNEPDYYRYTLRVPMASEPGESAVYCSCNPNLALGMVSRVTGESPMYTFDRLLGEPMKIHRYSWVLDPAGHPFGGGSVQLLPRDFLKLGQLMLNKGMWQGRRILGRDYVERSSEPLYHLRGVYYGYLWWGIDYPYKDRTLYAYYAGGAGGQTVVVVPELELVVATLGGNFSSRGTRFMAEVVPRSVLPAVRERGDDPNAPVAERNFVTPYGPSPVSGRVEKK